jgi:hypothetical protein
MCGVRVLGGKYGENFPKSQKRHEKTETRSFSRDTMKTHYVTSIETFTQLKTRKCAKWQNLGFPMILAFFSEKCCEPLYKVL